MSYDTLNQSSHLSVNKDLLENKLTIDHYLRLVFKQNCIILRRSHSMSRKIHVNTNTGETGECSTGQGINPTGCPFGGASGTENHFDSIEEAKTHAENILSERYGRTTTNKKLTNNEASLTSVKDKSAIGVSADSGSDTKWDTDTAKKSIRDYGKLNFTMASYNSSSDDSNTTRDTMARFEQDILNNFAPEDRGNTKKLLREYGKLNFKMASVGSASQEAAEYRNRMLEIEETWLG